MELRPTTNTGSPMRTSAWLMSGIIFFNSFLPFMSLARENAASRSYSSRPQYLDVAVAGLGAQAAVRSVELKHAAAALPAPGGPDQPEVKSFTPVGTSEMVNPFTGDFSYNIPLMDVDGYPINIAYDAGISMDQEASWVGLGWNLNPGVVNRVMRGIPDDFNGSDEIVKDLNLRDNFTVGVSGALGIELFGVDNDILDGPVSLEFKLGINYNNYNGFGSEFGITPGISVGKEGKPEWNFELGFTGSSTAGATISPALSVKKKTSGTEPNSSTTKQMSIASPFNSRAGWQGATLNYSKKRETLAGAGIEIRNGKPRALYKATSSITRPFSSSFNTGMSTFTPAIPIGMSNAGGTFSLKLGGDIIGFDGTLEVQGYYSEQWLKEQQRKTKAYGYMYLQSGQNNPDAMLDFNRENDGSFTKNTPALGIPSLTYDVFNVSGQGVGGSYRAQRPDVGYVFDPQVVSDGGSGSLGVEAGLGGTFKGGIDLAANYINSTSGVWDNSVTNQIRYTASNIYFREANEMSVSADPDHFNKIGGDQAARFHNPGIGSLDNILENKDNVQFPTTDNYVKAGKDRRNQVIYTLTFKDMADGLGIQNLHADAYQGPSHHIAQFTTLNAEGVRYVYGIAAYNHWERDVSFALGSGPEPDCATGLVTYDTNDATENNEKGRDHYFSKTTTPAYAHSYLLTTVLNPDYVDINNIKGPDPGDMGGYIKFDYKKVNNYRWRSPATLTPNQASFDEGFNTELADNKGHYMYGEKELWYVKTIETKNHLVRFITSDRKDGHGVGANEYDPVSGSNVAMQQLDRIELFVLSEYNANPSTAVPIKTVNFVYDFSLCKEYPQNTDGTGPDSGKLTLKRIYFTYRESKKGAHIPYIFHYDYNPNYDIKSMDRWGNYKAKPACPSGDFNIATDPLRPSDFPYVGSDKASVDLWAAAWNLTDIELPSGGKIEVDYESDDYAYVQHRRANQMFKITGVELYNPSGNTVETTGTVSTSNDNLKNAMLYFDLLPGYNDINDYTGGLTTIYFRSLMKMADGGYDFVPCYAEIETSDIDPVTGKGRIKLKPSKLIDNDPTPEHSPIAVAGIQFARIHLSNIIPPSNQSVDEDADIADLAGAILGAFGAFGEMFTGPNHKLWLDKVGTDLVIDHSWVRLLNPDKKKLGGGHRVKQIRVYDAWEIMTDNADEANFYGQEYSYTTEEDGTSSGVAAYEPQLGGDENPWRQPEANNTRNLLAPDARNYQETPFGEQFFPNALVGYSRVAVRDISAAGVTRTGKVVHEYYTAKDYPTITQHTPPQIERFKLPVFAFFFSMCLDEMSASQGFMVENNDMHGKPKSQKIYAEGNPTPITQVTYIYQDEMKVIDGIQANHLTSNATVIRKDGSVATATLGLNYEAVADFRKSTSLNVGGSISVNTNFTLPFLLVPTILGSGSVERTAFRSSSFTKVIERFGIVENTVVKDLGSEVSTKTIAYDAETGSPLLTETVTDFNDKVYEFTYPAHWYYDGMGQAYKSIDINMTFPSSSYPVFTTGVTTSLTKANGFAVGDEVAYVTSSNVAGIAWITEVNDNSIVAINKAGVPLSATIKKIRVVRSGRRNMQNTPVGSITLQTNPLTNLTGNVFEQVLQAGAVEYSEDWRTFCECFTGQYATNLSSNPYVLGLKGNWRPKASYTFLSDRTQSFENNNSNIRRDGQFVSYRPFYKFQNGSLVIDKQNWTYAYSVTEFSPFGEVLETVDLLDRYSSNQYGFNQTFATATAVNTRYSELGYDGFEDYGVANCIDNHFRLSSSNAQISTTQSHTGRKSIKVTSSTPIQFIAKTNVNCEPAACAVTTTDTNPNSTTTVAVITGGVAPYSIEYEMFYGITGFSINDNGDGFTITHDNPSKMRVIITDAEGCVFIKEYKTN